MKNTVYDCELAYNNVQAVWKEFQPYSASLEINILKYVSTCRSIRRLEDLAWFSRPSRKIELILVRAFQQTNKSQAEIFAYLWLSGFISNTFRGPVYLK